MRGERRGARRQPGPSPFLPGRGTGSCDSSFGRAGPTKRGTGIARKHWTRRYVHESSAFVSEKRCGAAGRRRRCAGIAGAGRRAGREHAIGHHRRTGAHADADAVGVSHGRRPRRARARAWISTLQDNGWGADQPAVSRTTAASPGATLKAGARISYWGLYFDLRRDQWLMTAPTRSRHSSAKTTARPGGQRDRDDAHRHADPSGTAPPRATGTTTTRTSCRHTTRSGCRASQSSLVPRRRGCAEAAVTTQEPLGTSDPLTASFDARRRDGHGAHHLLSSLGITPGITAVVDLVCVEGAAAPRERHQQQLPVDVGLRRHRPHASDGEGRGASNERWRHRAVVVRFSAKDGLAGVESIEYSITSLKAKKPGGWTTGTSAVVTQLGSHKVWYRAIERSPGRERGQACRQDQEVDLTDVAVTAIRR